MTSMDRRAPMMVNDLNKKISPMNKPKKPEMDSQSHCWLEAPAGRNESLTNHPYMPSNRQAMINRMWLTASDPARFPERSNIVELTDQQTETANAAISPTSTCSILPEVMYARLPSLLIARLSSCKSTSNSCRGQLFKPFSFSYLC